VAKTNRIVFQNSNGTDYFIVAGNDRRALLRGINYGVYVIRPGTWIGSTCAGAAGATLARMSSGGGGRSGS